MRSATLFLAVGAGAVVAATELAGQYTARMTMRSLFERQVRICAAVPPPYTCERSCGPGFITCVGFPHCYNPGRGDICCSDGSHCPKGYYCTDRICCPDGTPLSECGATKTLSIVLPNAPPASTPPAPATTAATDVVGTTETSASAATETTTATIGATETSAAVVVISSTPASNFSASATAPPIAIQTAGAPQGMSMAGAWQMVFGALGVWLAF